MADKRVSKVEAKHISQSAARVDELGRTVPEKEGARVTIDHAVLALLKSIPLTDETPSFEDRVALYAGRIGANLKAVRASLLSKDVAKLETLAFELSTNALMVGAVRILSSSYELQNAARLGDWTIAETLADQLDMEFLWAQDGLKEAAALK